MHTGPEHQTGHGAGDGDVDVDEPGVGRDAGREDADALRDGVHLAADVRGPVVFRGVVADQDVQAVRGEAGRLDTADEGVEDLLRAAHAAILSRSQLVRGARLVPPRSRTVASSSKQ